MKVRARPEGVLERIALAANLAPAPLVETQVAFNAARAIMAAAALGVFEALGERDRTADEVAEACGTHPRATVALLDCLVGIGYARYARGRYGLRKVHRKWLLRESPSSVVDKLAFQLTEWDWMARLEEFVRTGVALDFHRTMSAGEWAQYQDGMRDLSAGAAPELARRLPVRHGATELLDIGGSHGLYSIELCRRHPSLRSTILELPGALDRASALAARAGLGERVKHRAGDALTEDLGENTYDVIMVNNLVHHFSAEQNRELSLRAARALRPGGLFAVGEFVRKDRPGSGDAVAATAGLYFALTSASGTWSLAEIASWQRDAGLSVERPIRLTSMPGWKVSPALRQDSR